MVVKTGSKCSKGANGRESSDDARTIYAASWDRKRRPWDFTEGGTGSAIYKSVDGGDTWSHLEGGLPRSEYVGRIGLAVSAASPDTLYASIDNQQQLLVR